MGSAGIQSDSITPDGSGHRRTREDVDDVVMDETSIGTPTRRTESMKRKRSQSSHVDILPPATEDDHIPARDADTGHAPLVAMDIDVPPPSIASISDVPNTPSGSSDRSVLGLTAY